MNINIQIVEQTPTVKLVKVQLKIGQLNYFFKSGTERSKKTVGLGMVLGTWCCPDGTWCDPRTRGSLGPTFSRHSLSRYKVEQDWLK